MENQLVLGGHITRISETRRSPAGIPITRMVLEHRSIQYEANHPRQAQCRITVMVCGDELHRNLARMRADQEVCVCGFISRANNRQGEARLVLHAVSIEPRQNN